MAKYSIEDSTLTNIADAIRAKTGGTAALTPAAMDEALNSIPEQAAKTVTPSTTDQTAVEKGVFTTGAVTVKGDANLKAENIAEGVSIFDVAGSHKGGTFVPTCTVKVINNLLNQGAYLTGICYTTFENGEFKAIAPGNFIREAEVVFENVVCNSALHLQVDGYYYVGAELDNVIELQPYTFRYWQPTAENGGVATITMYDTD